MSHQQDNPETESIKAERFVELLTAHQRQLYGYIYAIIHNAHDTEELLQATTTVLWRDFDDFTYDTNFGAWAIKTARYRVLAYLKQQKTASSRFSGVAIEAIEDGFCDIANEMDFRKDALESCLKKLPEQQREVIRLRYLQGASTEVVAAAVGRSTSAVYKMLNRIHRSLLDCIQKKLSAQEGT